MNTLRQICAVSRIGLASLPNRFATAWVIVAGMASVVGVLTSMLSLTAGMTRAYLAPEDRARAVVWAGSAKFDQSQSLHRDLIDTILDAPGIATGPDHAPLADAEFVIPTPHREGFAAGSLQVRGIGPEGLALRPEFRIVAEHMFHPGRQELVAGVAAVKRFGLSVGGTVRLREGNFPIVGVFTYRGDILESYLVGDADTIFAASRRHGFAHVVAQLVNADAYPAFERWLTTNPTLSVTVEREADYHLRQLGFQVAFFTRMAYLIGAIMGLGALFGVVKIMYAVVRTRTREIGTLRAIGFGAAAVAVSVIAAAALLGVAGALFGTGLAWAIFDGHEIWVGGALRLDVSGKLLALGLAWALTASLAGGLFPALRAARIPAYEALRTA